MNSRVNLTTTVLWMMMTGTSNTTLLRVFLILGKHWHHHLVHIQLPPHRRHSLYLSLYATLRYFDKGNLAGAIPGVLPPLIDLDFP